MFYHSWLGREKVLIEQMAALSLSGLADAAREIHIGSNDPAMVKIAAHPRAHVFSCPGPSLGEYGTMIFLQRWLPLHPGWSVCYHHAKGAFNPGGDSWRRAMEKTVIWNWRRCAQAIEDGFDTAGYQWVEPYPGDAYPPGQRYWSGNFWWASSDYLAGLPALEARAVNGRYYEGEAWIGKSKTKPRIQSV